MLGLHQQAAEIFSRLVQYGKDHQDDDVRIDYFAVSLPDLLVFEDDLNARNYIHCKYISGLGYLGLKKFAEAENDLTEVLDKNAMHFGAKTHLSLLTDIKQHQHFNG